MQELKFLCMTRRLNVLYNMNIRCNTSNGNLVIEPHEIALQINDQREIFKAG